MNVMQGRLGHNGGKRTFAAIAANGSNAHEADLPQKRNQLPIYIRNDAWRGTVVHRRRLFTVSAGSSPTRTSAIGEKADVSSTVLKVCKCAIVNTRPVRVQSLGRRAKPIFKTCAQFAL